MLQKLLQLSDEAMDTGSTVTLCQLLGELNAHNDSVVAAGKEPAKTITVIDPAAPVCAPTALSLRNQSALDKLLLASGAAFLLKHSDVQAARPGHKQTGTVSFTDLVDGEEYLLPGPLVGASARLLNLEQYRGRMLPRVFASDFGHALLAEWKQKARFARLMPEMRELEVGGTQVEADVVLHAFADEPAEDEFVLGSVSSSVAGASDVDALVHLRDAYATHTLFKGHSIHLALLAVNAMPERLSAELKHKCKQHGVQLYQRSGSDVSKVEL